MIQTPRASRFILPLVVGLASLTTLAVAQEKIQFPDASQRANVKQRVGLTDVEIDYARPNKNDRQIFGGLVPHGKLWRTGANAPTKIKFSDAVKLGDKEIPAGEYVLLSMPDASEWTLIVSKDTKMQSTGDYKEENDAARITVKPTTLPAAVETFTIGLADVKGADATLHLDWDTTRVAVPLATDDIEKVSKQLETAAGGTAPLDARTAFQAASFYYDHNKDMNQAAKWIDQALEKNPKAYFMYMGRAQIQSKLGNNKEATASAQKTIEILRAGEDPDEGTINSMQMIIDSSK